MSLEKISDKVPGFVKEILNSYLLNSREANPDIEASGLNPEKAELFRSGFAWIKNQDVRFKGQNSTFENHVMVGSSSKFLFFNLFAKYFPEPSEFKFKVGLNYIAELVGRDDVGNTVKHMLKNQKIYKPFFDAIKLETEDLDGTKLQGYLADRIRERIKMLRQSNPNFEIEIPFSELCYSTLHVSANLGLYYLKQTLFNYWKLNENISEEECIERLDKEMKEFVKSFEPTKSTKDFAHWKQEGANTTLPCDYIQEFEDLILEGLDTSVNPAQAEILNNVKNNEIDFRFSFTNSEFGKQLQSKGWSIFEKTGSYPCVRWIPVLVKEGCPPHDVLFTAVTLIDPKGNPHSFCYYEMIHVALPDELDANGLPDEGGRNYEAYYKAVEARFYGSFRKNMENLVRENLSIYL